VIQNNTGAGGEQVFMQVGPLSSLADGSQIILLYLISYVPTATTLNVRVTLRRGTTIAGTLLTTLTDIVGTAGQLVERSGLFVDTPTTTAPQFYVLDVNNITTGAATVFTELQFFAFTL